MLIDRGYSLNDIPKMPPTSLISRYLSMSHEKGDSPMLDIPFSHNPILFLYEKDSLGIKSVQSRILHTLQYHSLDINTNITIVLLGSKFNDTIESKLNKIFPVIQVFHWKSLRIPIQNHMLVPKHTKLDSESHDSIIKQYKLMSIYQLPGIQVSDPMARHLFLSIGDIVHIDRNGTDAYRVCVPPLQSIE